MQNTSTKRRPFGIGIIALLLFIQAIFEIVVRPFTFIGTYLTPPFTGLIVSWMPLVVAVLLLILAWALWTLKRWAYWTLLIVELVNIVLHFFGYTLTHSIFALMGGGVLSIVVVIYLLVDGTVRRAFRTGIKGMQRHTYYASAQCMLNGSYKYLSDGLRPTQVTV